MEQGRYSGKDAIVNKELDKAIDVVFHQLTFNSNNISEQDKDNLYMMLFVCNDFLER